jgi:acetoin utilization deacetylase AcuC-like enzyme
METLYLTHPACRLHDMGLAHPESGQRLDAIADQLLTSGIANYIQSVQVQAPASPEALVRVHTAAHLERLASWQPTQGFYDIDGDTLMNAHTLEAARYAAGGVIQAVDAVMAAEAVNAFCAVRPPGHHAMPARAMGFCFFNNVAVGVMHALAHHGLSRVAVVDFDVHHGNGTEAIFTDEPRVLMCSYFQYPLFPGTGIDNPAPNMVNIPVPAYTDGAAIRELVQTHWLPRLHAYAPEMIFISAGFDAHREDDIAQLGLVENDYVWLTEQLMAVAEQHAQGRIVSVLEGGYNLSALARSVVAHVRTLAKL